MKPNPIIRRMSDGALFQEVPNTWHWDGPYCFYRVEWKQYGWIPWKRWARTGETWEPYTDKEFEVIS